MVVRSNIILKFYSSAQILVKLANRNYWQKLETLNATTIILAKYWQKLARLNADATARADLVKLHLFLLHPHLTSSQMLRCLDPRLTSSQILRSSTDIFSTKDPHHIYCKKRSQEMKNTTFLFRSSFLFKLLNSPFALFSSIPPLLWPLFPFLIWKLTKISSRGDLKPYLPKNLVSLFPSESQKSIHARDPKYLLVSNALSEPRLRNFSLNIRN